MKKKTNILFNKKIGHPVVNLSDDENVVLTTHPDNNYKSLKIENDDVIGFDASSGYFTDNIITNEGNGTFLGKLTKKGKSKLFNFLNKK